ncbi:hypothetical protein HPB51_001514 [Rhipicephalus microplus]|uniref:Uncharacterized protein n=1 Tax=Rhipicephalus microplus TaxID=6941 RepID=A0A9J6EW88_RHIMP|nr:hypothetical protein HPB51_001514 [Rhipicephalus microplus]
MCHSRSLMCERGTLDQTGVGVFIVVIFIVPATTTTLVVPRRWWLSSPPPPLFFSTPAHSCRVSPLGRASPPPANRNSLLPPLSCERGGDEKWGAGVEGEREKKCSSREGGAMERMHKQTETGTRRQAGWRARRSGRGGSTLKRRGWLRRRKKEIAFCRRRAPFRRAATSTGCGVGGACLCVCVRTAQHRRTLDRLPPWEDYAAGGAGRPPYGNAARGAAAAQPPPSYQARQLMLQQQQQHLHHQQQHHQQQHRYGSQHTAVTTGGGGYEPTLLSLLTCT